MPVRGRKGHGEATRRLDRLDHTLKMFAGLGEMTAIEINVTAFDVLVSRQCYELAVLAAVLFIEPCNASQIGVTRRLSRCGETENERH